MLPNSLAGSLVRPQISPVFIVKNKVPLEAQFKIRDEFMNFFSSDLCPCDIASGKELNLLVHVMGQRMVKASRNRVRSHLYRSSCG